MKTSIALSVLPGEEDNETLIRQKAAEILGVAPNAITALTFRKKSIDARRGRIRVNLAYTAWVGENPPESAGTEPGVAREPGASPLGEGSLPRWRTANPNRRVVIVGSGPAGLFAALRLLEDGITPIIVERGSPTPERKREIAAIAREGRVNADSNYCFGEGGAGTFSDGKLFTRSNKRGNVGKVLAIFRHHGADAEILTDAHPHIGSDRLPAIINAIRETIVRAGGEFHFNLRFVALELEGGADRPRAIGVRAIPTGAGLPGAEGAADAPGQTFLGEAVILATGHSATDVYGSLADLEASGTCGTRPILEAKGFAMGVRVEHPRELIDRIQYHGRSRDNGLPAAEYRLTAQVEGRGVYSFCMCPGGLIVPAASSDDGIVVNGMSPSSRNCKWSNAAIVVETRVEDAPPECQGGQANEAGRNPALAGLRYRTEIEREAKKRGRGQSAPAQRLVDFIEGKDTRALPECSYAPGIVPSRLDLWLPAPIARRLSAGFVEFNRLMRGFIADSAVVVGVETRTSSPVRIIRNAESLESEAIAGLYPAGEGAGYAGGIVSSAMDGERCAAAIAASR